MKHCGAAVDGTLGKHEGSSFSRSAAMCSYGYAWSWQPSRMRKGVWSAGTPDCTRTLSAHCTAQHSTAPLTAGLPSALHGVTSCTIFAQYVAPLSLAHVFCIEHAARSPGPAVLADAGGLCAARDAPNSCPSSTPFLPSEMSAQSSINFADPDAVRGLARAASTSD